jgi:hypothetical protein
LPFAALSCAVLIQWPNRSLARPSNSSATSLCAISSAGLSRLLFGSSAETSRSDRFGLRSRSACFRLRSMWHRLSVPTRQTNRLLNVKFTKEDQCKIQKGPKRGHCLSKGTSTFVHIRTKRERRTAQKPRWPRQGRVPRRWWDCGSASACRAPWKTAPSASRGIAPSLDSRGESE